MKHFSKRALAMLCALMILVGVVPFTAAVSAAETDIFIETFQMYGENDTVPGWTVFNTDGDAYTWYVDVDYSGEVTYVSASANSSGNFTPDETLTLPAVTIPSSVEANYFFAMDAWKEYPWGGDHFTVYLSTTPITDPTMLTEDQAIIDMDIWGYDSETFTCNLDAYRGQTVYLAIRHHDASGMWQFHVDNVRVYAEEADRFDIDFVNYDDAVTVTPLDGTYEAIDGQDYAFTLNVNDAFHPENGTLTVTANEQVLEPVNGVYTLKAVTEDQEVVIDFAYAAGDVNGDGRVSLLDTVRLFYGFNGMMDLHPISEKAGNIDTYKTFDVSDITALLHYTMGLRGYIDENRDMAALWQSDYADTANGFTGDTSCTDADYYLDRYQVKDYTAPVGTRDGKKIFFRDGKARVVNTSDGYAFTLPFDDFKADYSLSALRSRYENDEFVLNVSKENGNPYGNTAGGWNTYLTEWLNRYVANNSFLSANDLSRSRISTTSTKTLEGYTIVTYDIVIDNAGNIAMPYYSIAIVRKSTDYINFHLFVMKSTTKQTATMDAIVKSFKEFTPVGVSKNEEVAYECKPNKNWNAETAAYFEKLTTQSTTDWGFFTESMSDSNTSRENLTKEYAEMKSKLDYEYEIMPTYTHIGWGSSLNYFPSSMAAEFAGGNGFNGKPVLQFTYQYTTSNNGSLDGYTPMFDIMRGEYDDHFRRLARDIKLYAKPVLFRLNNEMNTDWTSYCGIVNLLDPDIFVITWERLYNIFEEEGVDNCIWIFNPFATSTPYCKWGEDLCYLPDLDTVQALGLTAYEMGNNYSLTSFKKLYSDLYEKNSPYFNNYPQIISEFGAGAGGEKQYNWSAGKYLDTTLGRNAAKQATWVKEMFDCLQKRDEEGYEFCQSIKGAVWFAVNDYVNIDGTNYITNFFELNDTVSDTVAAFKEGLAIHP